MKFNKVLGECKMIKSLFHFNASCSNVTSEYSSINQSVAVQGFSSSMVDHNPMVSIS